MQEKAKKKRSGLTARLEKRDATVWIARLSKLGVELLWGGVAFLLGQGEMLFGTMPLGLALLCAGQGHVLAVLIGLILSATVYSEIAVVYIVTYCIAAVIRVISRMLLDTPDERERMEYELGERLSAAEILYASVCKEENQEAKQGRFGLGQAVCNIRSMLGVLFSERIRLRMATAAICSLIVSLYRVIRGGFTYYDWFAALFCAVVIPAAVMVYSVYLDSRREYPWMYVASASALLFSVVWSSMGLSVFGISLPLFLAFFFALYASLTQGIVLGALAGILAGLAIDFLYAPAFLIAALVFSFFQGRKRFTAGILPAVFCSLIWLLYVEGIWQAAIVLPSLLLSGAIFTPVCAYLRSKEASEKEQNEEETERQEDESIVLRQRFTGAQYARSSAKLREISEAFSTLSEMFYNLSDRFRRPGTLDLRRVCDRAFDAHCADCPNKTVCWGLEYSDTLSTVNALVSALHTKGQVSAEQIPAHLSNRCAAIGSILEKINVDCAHLTGELLRNNRTEIFAMDYEAAAKIINDALEEDNGEYRFDPELEQRIAEYLGDAGIAATAVTVYGQRRRQILVRNADIEHASVTAETMRADLSEMCGVRLGIPTFEVEGNVSTMLMQAKKKFAVMGAQNNLSADGGVSGDTVILFSNKKDYFYALINDGMGSGREAALTSNLCSVFLEKMLRAGNRAGTSLRMLNNMICSRRANSADECSSTVDLLELDLMSGEVAFIKSGAAPSYVVRGGVVHRVQSGSAPIGIISKLDAQVKHYTVREGDTVVMISDGIEQNDPDGKWLTSYLSTCGDASPEEIVYQICVHAAECVNHDDCSAIALRIVSADE